MNKFLSAILVVIILAIVGFAIYQTTKGKSDGENSADNSANNTPTTSQPTPADSIVPGAIAILFYGNGCPHCANVDKWLTDNKVAEKVKFDRRETHNQDNSNLLSEKAKICGIAEEEIGVPFLYDTVNNKCYIGEIDVENFFKDKL